MLDILPGKILRPSQDTNSDSWPARGKTQMLEHWKKDSVQWSVKAPQYSEQSQILLSRVFVRHAHTHTLLPPNKEEEKLQGLMTGWGGYPFIMKGWKELRGAQVSSGHQQDVQGSSGWKALRSYPDMCCFPCFHFPIFSATSFPAPAHCSTRNSRPCPHHFTLHQPNPHPKELTLFLCLRSHGGKRDKQEKTEQAQPICAAETKFGTKQFSLRAVLYRKSSAVQKEQW